MFQIARGSGATLSEYTFSFKKAHVTKKTSSRQNYFKDSRQKEAGLSYTRVLFDKEPGYMLGNLSTKFKKRSSSSLYQIARGSGATLSECTFFFKKAHVTKKTSLRQNYFKDS